MPASALRSVLRPHLRATLKALVGRRVWVRLRAIRILAHPSERELATAITIVRRLAGGVTIDVGANNGLYAIPLTAAGSRLVAFDANPTMCEWLRSELPRSVTVENIALSEGEGRLLLRIPIVNGVEISGMGTIAEANNFASFDVDRTREIDVRTTSLDGYAASHLRGQVVTFIKIDVEGAEELVLRGAQNVLEQDRPVLLIETELRHGADVGAIFADLSRLDYQAYILGDMGDRLHRASIDDVPRLQGSENMPQLDAARSARYVNNFFFIPRARLPALRDLVAV